VEISTSKDFAIEAKNLTKRYGTTLANQGLSFTVRRGTTFGLLGPNGAGKSSAIRMLMGLSDIDEGSASLLGFDVEDRDPELRQRIGYVPELHFIYRWMTVAQVLKFVGALYRNWDTSLAEELLLRLDLPLSKKVKALSKGMTAKLGLLIALAHRPELLILDEPTSGLDPIIREDFLESVLASNTVEGRTILFSSHHVDDVERVADDVGMMVGGKMELCGTVDMLREQVKRVRFVLKDGTLPAKIPSEVIHQKLNRREWLVTLHPFSPELVKRIQAENKIASDEVFDLNLEDIFKDLVRGRLEAKGEAA
jgi:ABC-2 type transport system ATP-binding protein